MNVIVLRRRLIYICAMVLLLVPLYFLGKPSVRERDGSVKDQGGTLAQIRHHYNLGQGDLGNIDPASESMRLATLGLRGVAATILWQKAEYYKKEQFWDRLSATLQQIVVLQPHFVKVWDFQAHNLSYNVSSEFDDYRQRYQWVKKGCHYLIKGSNYNKRRTEMPFQLGWFFGSKLGIADEKKQFRAMYGDDLDFHEEILRTAGMDVRQPAGLGPDRKPDNWLSGVLWYLRSYDMADNGMIPAKSTMMFYREGPQWLMKYADGILADGIVDEAARQGWARAGKAWTEFGNRPIQSSWGDMIYLRELERANENYARLKDEFIEVTGSTYADILADAEAKLTPVEREAWEKEDVERTFEQVLASEFVARALDVNPEEVAHQVDEGLRTKTLQLASQLNDAKQKIKHIEIYRNQINYAYWEARCEAEQADEAIDARVDMFAARKLIEDGELDAALAKYDESWVHWHGLFNKFPAMMIDDAANDLLDEIAEYQQILDADLPEDFVLLDFMKFRKVYDDSLADPALMSVIAAWPKRFPGRDFLTEMLTKADLMIAEAAKPTFRMERPDVTGSAPLPPAEDPAAAAADDDSAAPPTEVEPEATPPAEADSGSDAPAEDESVSSEESPVLELRKPESGKAPVPQEDK